MRMALTGSKHVQGFDINKHQQMKRGSLFGGQANKTEATEEEEPEEATEVNEEDTSAPVDFEEPKEPEIGAAEANADEEVKQGNEDQAEDNEEDEADKADLAKLIKEEDINMVPESTDVTEIDKLTGMPKPIGK